MKPSLLVKNCLLKTTINVKDCITIVLFVKYANLADILVYILEPIPPKVKIVYVPVPCKNPKMPPKDLLQTPKLPFPTDPSMPMKDPTFMTKESYHGNFNPNDPLSMILGDASTYMPKQRKFGVDTNGIMTSGGQFLGYPATGKNLASNFGAFLKPSYSGNDEQQSVR